MILKVGAWFTEEWLEQAGPKLAEAGFKVLYTATDPGSSGEYQHYVLDYVGEQELEWDAVVGLLADVRAIVESQGQDLSLRVARS